ncbi:MAG: HAD family hydrolase [Ruthenibacterium sp.]
MTLFWDWNGTLLNDVMLCSDLINEMLTSHGYAPVGGLDAYRAVFCFPIETYYQNAGFDFSRHPFAQLADEYIAQYSARSVCCPLQPHTQKVLRTLQQRGVQQLILSASPISLLREQVTKHGITSYFDALLGLDNVYAKSKVAPGKAWLTESGLSPADAIMIGDSVHDYEVSLALGTGCVLYSGGHQPRAVLAATGAPVIDDLTELLSLR